MIGYVGAKTLGRLFVAMAAGCLVKSADVLGPEESAWIVKGCALALLALACIAVETWQRPKP